MFSFSLLNIDREDTILNDGTSLLINPGQTAFNSYRTVDIRSVEPIDTLSDYFDFSTEKWYFYVKVPAEDMHKLIKKCGGIAVNNCPPLDLPN